jgi:hypothetical protein
MFEDTKVNIRSHLLKKKQTMAKIEGIMDIDLQINYAENYRLSTRKKGEVHSLTSEG